MSKKKSRRPSQPPRVPRSAESSRERSAPKRTAPPARGAKTASRRQPARNKIPRWILLVALAGLIIALLLIFFVSRSMNRAPAAPVPPAATQAPAAAGTAPATAAAEPTPAPTGAAPTALVEATPASAQVQRQFDAPPPMTIDTDKQYTAMIETARGNIGVELYPKAAPQTVNNFVFLARNGFYDGLTFHRVEPGFVIQGGDPSGDGTGGPGYTLPAEIELTHGEGAVAMARRPDQVNPERRSSGSQFYITLAPTPHLDGGYTVFGQVVEGMDVAQSIAIGDVIESVTIQEE